MGLFLSLVVWWVLLWQPRHHPSFTVAGEEILNEVRCTLIFIIQNEGYLFLFIRGFT